MALAGDLIAKQNEILALAGTDVTLESVGGGTRNVRAAVLAFGKYDGELINSIGIEGRKVQIGAITPAPVKFDRIIEPVTGMEYTIHDVRAAVVDGTLIGYTCICTGI
jgi:hypothetical protein